MQFDIVRYDLEQAKLFKMVHKTDILNYLLIKTNCL